MPLTHEVTPAIRTQISIELLLSGYITLLFWTARNFLIESFRSCQSNRELRPGWHRRSLKTEPYASWAVGRRLIRSLTVCVFTNYGKLENDLTLRLFSWKLNDESRRCKTITSPPRTFTLCFNLNLHRMKLVFNIWLKWVRQCLESERLDVTSWLLSSASEIASRNFYRVLLVKHWRLFLGVRWG